MGRQHLVRFSALGQLGHFAAVDATRYPRGARVVLRTMRGLELGEVLASPDAYDGDAYDGDVRDRDAGDGNGSTDGAILRGVTVADELLAARLEKNRRAALAACEARLRRCASDAVLMDAEHLFDGRTLWFYFLGEVTPEVSAITDELAEIYDAEVQLRRFAETLSTGCGPDCGTESATGGGCQSCSTGCAVAAACHPRGGA